MVWDKQSVWESIVTNFLLLEIRNLSLQKKRCSVAHFSIIASCTKVPKYGMQKQGMFDWWWLGQGHLKVPEAYNLTIISWLMSGIKFTVANYGCARLYLCCETQEVLSVPFRLHRPAVRIILRWSTTTWSF